VVPGDAAVVEAVCARAGELLGPPEPPARVHGDLWAGNVLAGADGRWWLVDAGAAHGGWREADLALLALFGGLSTGCRAAYGEALPLTDGWEERVALHQLHPLLVHAALFGGGYGRRAVAVARSYR
nr:fructosamine kinase family protein [Acidimicrobiia bacterium]